VELHSTPAVVVLVVVVVPVEDWFTTLSVEGCFLRGKLPLFLLFVMLSQWFQGQETQQVVTRVLDLMLGQKKTDYKVYPMVSLCSKIGDFAVCTSVPRYIFLSVCVCTIPML
jgi:hypothetical protein